MYSDQQFQPQPQPPTATSETQAPVGYLQGNADLSATGSASPQMTSAVPAGTGNAPNYQGGGHAAEDKFSCGCNCCCLVVGGFGVYSAIQNMALGGVWMLNDEDPNMFTYGVLMLIGSILSLIANGGLIVGVMQKLRPPCLVWMVFTVIQIIIDIAALILIFYDDPSLSTGPVVRLAFALDLLLLLGFIIPVALFVKNLKKQLVSPYPPTYPQTAYALGPAVQTPSMIQQYYGMAVPGTQTQPQYYGGNTGYYPSTFGPPNPYQTLAPQPLMQNSDGVDLNAGPGQPYPASLATQS